MARGGPDWYGALGTTYGIVHRETWDAGVDGDAETEIIAVTGRGTIVAGFVYSYSTVTHKNDVVKLYLDGELMTDLNFILLNRYGFKRLETYPVYITRFNNVKKRYAVGIIGGLTFNQSFSVGYANLEAVGIGVRAQVIYSLI